MKKKLSLFSLFLAMPFVIFGAIQIWWYSQAPHATSVNDTDIMLVERPVPHTNLWFNMAQLKSYTSTGITNLTGSNAYITVLYSLTNFIDYITVTNGITNLSLNPNTVLKADGGKQIASIPNGTGALTNDGAGNFGWNTTINGASGPWTNNTDFTWLSGFTMATNGAPQTAPFSIWTNASFFVGPDVFQDIAQDPTTVHFPYAVLLTDSNGPTALQFSMNVYDSLAGSAFSKWFSTVSASQSSATYENSIHNDKLSWRMQTVSEFDFSTNTVSIFHINNDGLTTANGYVDSSGNVGDLVAYGAAGRLVSTNVTAIISGLTNIQQNFATTNNSSTLTNIISSIASNAVPVQTNFAFASITNLLVETLNSATNYFGEITVTNGITNLSLTANTVLEADANRRISSIANAAGALTNNGSGTVGYYNSFASQPSANAFAGSNYFGSTVTTSTNLTFGPDFSVEESVVSTNAAFTFTAPVGVDTAGKTVQWTLVNVTNTTAAAVLITSPANCHTVGVNYVTNWTAVWFQCYAQKITNAYYIPVF